MVEHNASWIYVETIVKTGFLAGDVSVLVLPSWSECLHKSDVLSCWYQIWGSYGGLFHVWTIMHLLIFFYWLTFFFSFLVARVQPLYWLFANIVKKPFFIASNDNLKFLHLYCFIKTVSSLTRVACSSSDNFFSNSSSNYQMFSNVAKSGVSNRFHCNSPHGNYY